MAKHIFCPPDGAVHGFHWPVIEFQGQLLHVVFVAEVKSNTKISRVSSWGVNKLLNFKVTLTMDSKQCPGKHFQAIPMSRYLGRA